jgi:TonB family protein
MFWIALAAQFTAPIPTNLNKWFSPDDVPEYLLRKSNGVWLVGVRVTVTPDGLIQSCQIEASSGIPELNTYTCALLTRRAKFHPAQGDDGNPAFGVHRTYVLWAVSEGFSPPDLSKVSLPDLDLTVLTLPKGTKSPALARVMFKVDAEGRISSCAAEQFETLDRIKANPDLTSTACQQIVEKYQPIPAKDTTGKAVSSVQDATVRFSVTRR